MIKSARRQVNPAVLVLTALLVVFTLAAEAKPNECDPDRRTSFTNLATHLLATELDTSYGYIQVYPTNEYTPAVHRILQVSANLHEAARPTESNAANAPSVFKPIFAKSGQTVFVAGYEEVIGDARGRLGHPRDLENPNDRDVLQPNDNVYGVPWIIAARKGLPNFNELAVDNIFEISRGLEIRKPAWNLKPNETNQLFLVSASSAVGIEAWNSYRTALTRPVTVILKNRLDVGLQLTNQPTGLGSTHSYSLDEDQVIEVPAWDGTGPGTLPAQASFLVPLATNVVLLSNGVFRANGNLETSLNPPFDRGSPNAFPIPSITLVFTNSLQFAILDTATGTILDYVHLKPDGGTNLIGFISDPFSDQGYSGYQGLWTTNRLGGDETDIHAPPFGVINQIDIALGKYGSPGNFWREYGFSLPTGQTADKAIANFRSFITGERIYFPPYNFNSNLVEQVPFMPAKRIRIARTWQANDPLVHHMGEELEVIAWGDGVQSISLSLPSRTLRNIGRLNDHYEPWGGNPDSSVTSGSLGSRRFDLRFKDPLIRRSDDWTFPSGEPLTSIALGRIHRGTPWQTLYCKADGLSSRDWRDWRDWTGTRNFDHAVALLPKSDWNLVASLIAHLWPEKPNKLLSVNEPKRHKWLKALDGIYAMTNTTPDEVWQSYDPAALPQFQTEVISFKSEQAENIVDGIQGDRAREPNGYFENVGGIFAVEELSTKSPFLNLSGIQREHGITDEGYEAIALQLLLKLRPDSVGKWVMKNGRPHLRFSGLEHCRYQIESSTDLIHWKLVRTEAATHGCVELELAPDGSEGCRFYRSVLVEEKSHRDH